MKAQLPGAEVGGSGFLVGDARTVVSNFHVFGGAESATVVFADSSAHRVIGFRAVSPDTDLILVEIEPADGKRSPLQLRASLPEKGEAVAAFGSPLGFGHSMSSGIVGAIRSGSELNAQLKATGHDGHSFAESSTWIQFTSPIAHGSSGGPLVAMDGQVVGITTLGNFGANLAFAISALDVAPLLKKNGTLQPLAALPKPAVPEVADAAPSDELRPAPELVPPLQPAPLAHLDEWKIALLQVYEKRQQLLQQKQELDEKIITVERQIAETRTAIAPFQTEAKAVNQKMVQLSARAAALRQQMNFVPFGDNRLALENDLAVTLAQYEACSLRLLELNSLAAPFTAALNGSIRERGLRAQQSANLWTHADQLRLEWLRLTDPFGRWTRGEHEAAFTVLTEWVVLDSAFAPALVARGLAYYGLEKYEHAIWDLDRAVALQPKYAEALAAKALVLGAQGRKSESDRIFKDAVKLDRESDFVYVCRGLAFQAEGEFSGARSNFTRAVKLNPDSASAHGFLGRLLACCPDDKIRDGKAAVEMAEKACQLSGYHGWMYLDTLAAAHAETGQFEEAAKWATTALELAPAEAKAEVAARRSLYAAGEPFRLE